jgi:putative membrane protein
MTESPPIPSLLPDSLRDRTAYAVIGGTTALVLGFLFWLIYLNAPTGEVPIWTRRLPGLNAVFNGLSAGLVVAGVVAIRARRPRLHMGLIAGGLAFSALFLVSYILHHAYVGDTRFAGEGGIRVLYFFILISHILLSMIVVPMILTTLFFALTGRWRRHRKIARVTFPVWLYVSITGIAVFLFLRGS